MTMINVQYRRFSLVKVMHLSFVLLSIAIAIIFISCCHCSLNLQPNYNYHKCLGPDNEIASDSYLSNLNASLDSFPSKVSSNTTFYNGTLNGVYSLFLCRGDISSSLCEDCIKNATHDIRQRCPNDTNAIMWYDLCMLRYSNVSFFGVEAIDLGIARINPTNSSTESDPDAMQQIWGLIGKAPYSKLMFGTDQESDRYGLVQCTRDMNSSACKSCLTTLLDGDTDDTNNYYYPECKGKIGWSILTASCSIRYENYLFFEPTAPSPSPSESDPVDPSDGGGNNTIIIVVAIGGSLSALVAALVGFWYYKKRRKSVEGMTEEILLRHIGKSDAKVLWDTDINGTDPESGGQELCFFNLAVIHAATNNFSKTNKLGEGGFGPVYKGKLPNGTEIAVKRLSMKSKQGLEEFTNEVKLIAKLQHKNLVRLLGYCLKGDEKLLVYEYMANTSLDAFLFDPQKSKELNWLQRANIVMGTARGLLYLHEDSRLKIIHRDMKASNVLLDDEMNPKISDFGTARIFGGKQIEANTERVVGTYGYMAPEYALEGLYSVKSDVYSFGVLLLETISGEKNRNNNHPEYGQSLIAYAWRLWSEEKASELIDSKIADSCPKSEALQWIHIALLCIQNDLADRPTMSEVVQMLSSKNPNLPPPTTPPYTVGRFISFSDISLMSGTGTGTKSLMTDKSTTSTSTSELL